ncbi:MAG TPA: hypothetical protein VD969_07620 [Symbiobacteriaceae bacterium]|nr:hypothetical protein [Symbiobacteriaceae bacterium]
MQRAWRWVAAVIVLGIAAGTGGLYATGYLEKGIRYVQRQYGWGQEGRRARYEAAWPVAVQEYRQATGATRVPLGEADYPAKSTLTSQPDETVARLRSGLLETSYNEDWSRFAYDLLIALDREEARRVVQSLLVDQPWQPGLADAAEAVFGRDDLKQMLFSLPTWSQGVLIARIGRDLSRDELERLMLAYPNGDWPLQLTDYPERWELLLSLYPRLQTGAKIRLLEQMSRRQGQAQLDFAALLQTEQDPAVRQFLLLETGDDAGYLASLERDGFFRAVWLPWEKERALAARYPDSFLARGIAAYEAVRGLPYFEIDRRSVPDWGLYRHYGNKQYDCDREIRGWISFLADFSKHEGADDAAYRLGRCYEIRGDYPAALRALEGPLTGGDGEMEHHARSRIIWLLDVQLSEAELRGLSSGIPDAVKPGVVYTLAVKQLRAGRYADGAALLQAFISRYDGQNVITAGWRGDRWNFWAKVKEQQQQAARLAALAAAGDDFAARYELAAAVYHDEFLFYNHLWGGSRQYYMMDALLALQGDFDPVHTRWVAESNNYIQSAALFEQLSGAPAPIAEKAAYSRAMAFSRLYGFGRDVALWKPVADMREAALKALEEFVAKYPRSALAPDALLSLGYQTGNSAYFERIRREYPKSGAAGAAADKNRVWHFRTFYPFRYVDVTEVPPEAAAQAAAVAGKDGITAVTVGEWTYVVAGVASPSRVELMLWDVDGAIEARATALPHTPGPGYAIARIPATVRPVRTLEF